MQNIESRRGTFPVPLGRNLEIAMWGTPHEQIRFDTPSACGGVVHFKKILMLSCQQVLGINS
jgi:hypothetical protein